MPSSFAAFATSAATRRSACALAILSLFGGRILSTMAFPGISAKQLRVERAIRLMQSVYGNFQSTNFPLPLPEEEAGPCDNGQRRYLWTDAFAVLNLVSLAEACPSETTKFLGLANQLVDTVHDSLGKPRSALSQHAMQPDASSPSGYVGLRIGKVHSRVVTDAGMSYDGQYWHYIDKWLLALIRLGRPQEAARVAKCVFGHFYDATGGGMRWKLSVDATAPGPLQYQPPGDDTLTALIVFSLIEHHLRQEQCAKYSLQNEIDKLRQSLVGYKGRVTSDPLGWGLAAMYDQWLERKRTTELQLYAKDALSTFHMSLPFRLYGALLGAKLCPKAVDEIAQELGPLVEMAVRYEESHIFQGTHEEHSSINRVMLATVLLTPGALGRMSGEPSLSLR